MHNTYWHIMVNPLGGLNVFNHSATKVNNKPNMHAWNLFGYFDRTLCLLIQLWLDIGQFVWNLAFYSPCTTLDGIWCTTSVGDHPCFLTFYNYDPY